MKRIPLHAAAWLLCAILSGCATFGLPAPRDPADRIAYLNGDITGLATSTSNSLKAGRIGSPDAKYVSNVAKESAGFVDAAEAALAGGDIATAEGRLKLAESILTALETYLTSKEKRP